jgi:hypothetical protein
LFVTHLNVSELDMQVSRVPEDRFVGLLADSGYYDPPSNFRPTERDILRTWTIQNVAPRNVMRYELLQPGEVTDPAPVRCHLASRRAMTPLSSTRRMRSTPALNPTRVQASWKSWSKTTS